MASPKIIVLRSSDGETFEVDEAVALESQTIKHMIEVGCADTTIPLPNVTSEILSKVIEYCKKHAETPNSDEKVAEEELKLFDAEFVKANQSTLIDLILAANYLNIERLLDLTCLAVEYMIKGKTTEEIRKMFNIETDLTPEEEEEVRRENAWVFEEEEDARLFKNARVFEEKVIHKKRRNKKHRNKPNLTREEMEERLRDKPMDFY